MAEQKYARFLSKKSMVSLIGIDYAILEQSENDNLSKFYLASTLVIGILIVSFLSVFYAFDLMFDMWHAEILLSSFFSLMFFTIYIFLIQTFSKEVFPTTSRFKFFNLSNLSRLGFVLMIGFLIAQPIKVFILREQLDKDIELYKAQLAEKFRRSNTSLYHQDLNNLKVDIKTYQLMPKSETLDAEIIKINTKISIITEQIKLANNRAEVRIERSNFLIKRIEFASQYGLSSLLLLTILGLFFAPIALIYSISGTSRYYKLKKANDRRLVLKDYALFKKRYAEIFCNQYGLNQIAFHEPFLDPPFNTVRKPQPTYASQNDFFDNLFSL